MTGPVFVDTNVFIYAFDDADADKQRIARRWRAELWHTRMGRVSFQVLQEFYAKINRKWPFAVESARAEIRDLIAWKPVPLSANLLESGWRIQDRYRLSFWDAMIVAAAKAASCPYLLSEDLHAGQNLGGVIVVDPFANDVDGFAG